MSVADVAGYLQEVLGQKLVAYMAGVEDVKAVGQWAAGKRSPHPDNERRLRAAFQIFHMLQEAESPHTVRAWLIGLNPQLDDRSPATLIREDSTRDVLVAVKAFLAGG